MKKLAANQRAKNAYVKQAVEIGYRLRLIAEGFKSAGYPTAPGTMGAALFEFSEKLMRKP